MIKFLFKGVWRDASRSRLPIIIVSIGVFLTIVMSAFVTGVMGDMVDTNARFTTGHVKVMTRAYAENSDQLPNDLALIGVDSVEDALKAKYPNMQWVQRIRFGGLMDVPDDTGETRAQGPVSGLAVELFNKNSGEQTRLNIKESLRSGKVPSKSGEILISDELATKLDIQLGDEITFFGTTMYGSMTFKNFTVAGTLAFGSTALDRGGIIIDIQDAREALNMEDATGELLGYFNDGQYDDERAQQVAQSFNQKYEGSKDEFAPVMLRLKEQNQLASMIDYTDNMTAILVGIFIFAMSIVLWNTGLLGGLRRYSEFGVRLALGEPKGHIYRTLIYESVLIGIIGSVVGTAVGLGVAFYLQENGLDFSEMMESVSMMMPTTYRARITASTLYIGFIPGLFSMVLGQALSGIGVYKRDTAQLFKELEV
ncbi:putative ABC transport system permease protein [Catalinimonas alkaloidigena]|uniref:ABC transporter permease n=1 Tax=Catalinimonas alkaloidigena TaxID=1075417 RepID=UPI0024069CD0|nr:FtsX-like permease family protein [Catalinimonas alkaloidigena]MDF9796294.1 putative ABC transport system permease protein [Catalinimonas alkaloidigena]